MSNIIFFGAGGGGGGGVLTLTADIGGAVGPDGGGTIFISGAGFTTTAGNPGGNTITITSTSGGFTWNEELGVAVNLAVGDGYIMNNAGGVTGTLPAVAALGDTIRILGKGAGGWGVIQNAGQTCYVDSVTATTTGVAGGFGSTDQFDAVDIICITANTDFKIIVLSGNIAVI